MHVSVRNAIAVLAALVGGIAASIATTGDNTWVTTYFSKLGTHPDLSGLLFALGMVISGGFLARYAAAIGRAIRASNLCTTPAGPAAISGLLAAMGANLALIGMVPISVDKHIHDLATLGVAGSFVLLMLTAPLVMRQRPAPLLVASFGAVLVLGITCTLLNRGTISLTLFEVLAATIMFGWGGTLTRAVVRAHRAVEAARLVPVQV